jgi:hypothetical protein
MVGPPHLASGARAKQPEAFDDFVRQFGGKDAGL